MKKTMLALAAITAITAFPTLSFAQTAPAADAPAAEAPASMFAFNVGAVTDYRYRGISQTRFDPAVQGGIDVSLPQNFYVGTWLSNIHWIRDAGGNNSYEWDIYGGWKGEIVKDWTLDVGLLRYQYNGNDLPTSANTNEVYGALSWGPATLKISDSFSNLFGFPSSHNSTYTDLSAGFDVGYGITLTPHVGYQDVHHNSNGSYVDASLTAAKDLAKGLTASLAVVGTDTKDDNGTYSYISPNGKNLGRATVVAGIKYTF